MAFDDPPSPHAATHAVGAADPLTGYVDTTSTQAIGGRKTFSLAPSFAQSGSSATPNAATVTLTTAASSPVVDINASTNAVVVGLPTTTSTVVYTITKIDNSANTVGISPGTGAIGGYAGTVYLRRQYDSVVLQGSGSNGQWRIVGGTFNPLRPAVETLYTQTTVKAGDTIQASAGTSETAFASQIPIPAGRLMSGAFIHAFGFGGFSSTTGGPSQTARVRFGPSATALTSRAVAANSGALNLILPSVDPAGYRWEWMGVVESVGTSGVIRTLSKLDFVSMGSGQSTPFLAGPAPAVVGSFNFDNTVDNFLTLTDQFSSATNGNRNVLNGMTGMIIPPSVYSS